MKNETMLITNAGGHLGNDTLEINTLNNDPDELLLPTGLTVNESNDVENDETILTYPLSSDQEILKRTLDANDNLLIPAICLDCD